ncbi:alanine dehydrogenase [Pseudogracilibacillus auburnensis]|uniref:Alanine dehydrogenase n=1 Tax=Pseudogracilibacillus auburnensis TaxID=1494959 RepID=A0A2V3VUJ1_9BACI|nr:alanine dehydrogenase [Pseudogracilibacillus auburnensis]MBO1003371.1 alanine dehydrogenase [Pseudogracilibacillus auburnensis]PXW85326.1 L-alanine dehydrogenase [Pseudogracilibacillus auburnensis]
MKIGIPTEILNNENRVALTPAGVHTLTGAGHEVYVQTGAGEGSSFSDEEYTEAGAMIVATAKEAWSQELIMKVKEPLEEEYDYFYEGQILFTYLHLASHPELTKVLVDNKVIGIAYETVQLPDRSLPLLTPMSEVAGYMATQIGAQFLEKTKGGKGILLSGISGVKRGKVTIIGGGVVGTNAAKLAVGLGANVTIFDLNPVRLKELTEYFGNSVNVLMSNPFDIAKAIAESDLAIGSVLIPGAKAPVLVTEEMVQSMSESSVIVDVAIDQGGNFATSDRVTTHDDPIFIKHGVLHYTVANMPGAVPRTSTIGLTNATVPYALQIANKGYEKAVRDNDALLKGINTIAGKVTNQGVASALGYDFVEASSLIK